MRIQVLISSISLFISLQMNAQEVIPLYDGDIPNSKPVRDDEKTENRGGITIVSGITTPTLSVFLPSRETTNGAAVIICPGGGYWVNAISHEGFDVARKLNEFGITAFVLKYRIPSDASMTSRETGPLQDAQQAIALVRKKAKQWNIAPDRIGIMGFSAGGHLASTAGTHFEKPVLKQTVSVRPDFMILIYPVISFQPEIGHMGSRDQLIGKNARNTEIDRYSNELQVTEKTPPAFLVHAADDDVVPVENTTTFFSRLKKFNVSAEMHVYQKGGHGFGMNNKTTDSHWMDACRAWLISNGWLAN